MAPPRASQLLETERFSWDHAFHIQTSKLRVLYISYSLCPCPNHPGLGTRNLGTALVSQKLQKVFKLASPEILPLPHLFLPEETQQRFLSTFSPSPSVS